MHTHLSRHHSAISSRILLTAFFLSFTLPCSLHAETATLPEGAAAGTESCSSLSGCASSIVPPSSGLSVVFVLDQSGSMFLNDPDYLTRRGAENFLKALRSANIPVRAALVPFSDTLGCVTDLTDVNSEEGRSAVLSQIDALTYTHGDTDIGLAMEKAVALLDGSGSNAAIVLLTDGEIDLPHCKAEAEAEKESLTKALVAAEHARENGWKIHTIGLDKNDHLDVNLLTYLADRTDGSFHNVNGAESLPDLFTELSASVAVPETEAATEAAARAETEMENSVETETETEAIPGLVQTGRIDGPIKLAGLVPSSCTARLNLNTVFGLNSSSGSFGKDYADYSDPVSSSVFTSQEGSESPYSSNEFSEKSAQAAVRYNACAENADLADCVIQDGFLTISGLKNGSTTVYVYAEGPGGQTLQEDFDLTVNALFPSMKVLAALAGSFSLLIAIVLVLTVRKIKAQKSSALQGTLQWYVKSEGEKIFGIPTQQKADLSQFKRKVRLSELIKDELLSGSDLAHVYLGPSENGITLTSKTGDCALCAGSAALSSRIRLNGSGRFKIYCTTSFGKAAVMALYCSPAFEDSPAEQAEEEQTRMLM